MNYPFIEGGLLEFKAVANALILRSIILSSNDFLPTGTIKFFPESTLNSIDPDLAPLTASAKSYGKTNVPALGLGISPFVPRSLANGFK
jgi:hypothetical protein